MLDDVVILLQGFGLVMGVLAALWLVSALLGRALTAQKSAASKPAPAAPAIDAPGVPPAHLAAITAALAAVTGGGARIVRVRIPAHGIPGWIGSAHTNHAVGRRMATTWRTPSPARTSTATGSREDAQ